jgi:hypothetical protein
VRRNVTTHLPTHPLRKPREQGFEPGASRTRLRNVTARATLRGDVKDDHLLHSLSYVTLRATDTLANLLYSDKEKSKVALVLN